MLRLISLITLLLLSTSLLAETAPTYNRISFNEHASADAENDILVAVLYVQREGSNAQKPSREVNRIMSQAIQHVRPLSDIKAQTLDYRTNPMYRKNQITGWRVRQSLRLESKNSELLSKTIGELQQTMHVQSIGYQVSDGQRRLFQEKLTDRALKRFQQRAKQISQTLGKRGYKLVKLNINHAANNLHRPQMMMSRMADSAAGESAAIEAGTQKLVVTVNGEIELLD
jgi:predicted secreted protein